MMKKYLSYYALLTTFLFSGFVCGQTTTIDFETNEDGYTSTTTEGSTFMDVFNRIDASAAPGGNIGGNSGFIWAVEDTNVTPGSITLDQIDVTGSTSFTFSIDMLAHHFEDWDSTDELNITYSLDSGSAQNLMSVQMVPNPSNASDSSNGPAALDTDFDGNGDCGSATTLPAIFAGTQHGCTVANSNFATFVTNPIALSGNTTLDIVLSFENLTANDEGIYLDNLIITQSAGALPPSVGFDNITSTQNETNSSFAVDIPVTLSDYDGNQVDLAVTIDASSTAEAGDYSLNTSTLSFNGNGTQNVNIFINDDSDFNSEDLVITISETTSTGAIVNPDTHTLTIIDDETAPLVINEILADPDGSTGDANGDGIVDTSDDEFVEIFNNSSSSIDMSNYTLSDGFGVRHTFPSGTVLLAQQAIVVFGGGNVEDFTGVPGLVQVAGTLGLNNGGDTITIADAGGTPLVVETYGSASNDQSIARDPDFSGVFVDHSTITSNPVDFSPGSSNVDGTSLTPPNTWTGDTDTNWSTASNWNMGIVPREVDNIIIPNGLVNYPIVDATTGAVGTDLTVDLAASLIIQSGGSLILKGTSTGDITYLVSVADTNWHLVGSPVIGQDYNSTWMTDNDIATGTGTNRGISNYDNGTDADGNWIYQSTGDTGSFVNGQGYSLLKTVAGDYTFTGTLQTDDVSRQLTVGNTGSVDENKWNLVANPYASYINIGDFLSLASNASSIEDTREAVYVWNGSSYLPLTTGFIHPGQGIFINANANFDSVEFTELMTSHQTGVSFYSTPSASTSIVVNLSNGLDTKSTTINYQDGKTLGLDPRFDLGTFNTVPGPFDLSSKLVDGSYADTDFMIQSLPANNLDISIIPLNVNVAAGSDLSFYADALNLPLGYNVYLEDRLLNIFTAINSGNSYDLNTATEISGTGRFFLHTSTQTLSNEFVENNLDISISQSNFDTLSITGLNGADAQVSIYDLLGKQILSDTIESSSTTVSVNIANLKTGVYIAQLSTGNASKSQKIIINK